MKELNVPQSRLTTTSLPIMEQFYTIQGEGYHQGKAAYFIRVGGCDVGCTWCDVKESWDAGKHPNTEIQTLVEKANQYAGEIVVVTGGEPLMYDMEYLTKSLQEVGLKTHIETSAAYPLSGKWDWVCVSPKKFKAPLPDVMPLADELKIIVFNKHDFKWAEEYAAQVSDKCHLYLQPEWSKVDQMLPLMIEYAKENPKWQVSLQMHKYIGVP